MPNNLQALIRYRTIDQCLRSREKNYHLKDLIEACNVAVSEYSGKSVTVSRRTLLYDLDFLRNDVAGFNAPIEYDHQEGYYYTAQGFSIFNIPIRRYDIDVLRDVMVTLQSISGQAQFHGLASIIVRMEETYNIVRSRQQQQILQFDHSLNEAGQKWVDVLYPYTKAQMSLSVQYQPFGAEAYTVVVSPYLLREYNNRWFLIAWDHQFGAVTNLALDRIRDVKKSLQPYHRDESFDASNHLKDVVGVSLPNGNEKQRVVFKAFGRQPDYLLTKPIHPSQHEVSRDGEATFFAIDVIPNYELEAVFLSRGEDIEVVEPEWLRKKMGRRILDMGGRYV